MRIAKISLLVTGVVLILAYFLMPNKQNLEQAETLKYFQTVEALVTRAEQLGQNTFQLTKKQAMERQNKVDDAIRQLSAVVPPAICEKYHQLNVQLLGRISDSLAVIKDSGYEDETQMEVNKEILALAHRRDKERIRIKEQLGLPLF